jgi:hypothetical protein
MDSIAINLPNILHAFIIEIRIKLRGPQIIGQQEKGRRKERALPR